MMADGGGSVEALLKQTKAKNAQKAKDDVLAALGAFGNLTPSSESFAFAGKKLSLTFTLSGTIPIIYKSNRYHIPVSLYLSSKHPNTAPSCFVRPTSEMKVKPSRTVDDSGRISHPYLAAWKVPGSDLTGLLQMLVVSFQESCPVYSTASQTPGPSISRFPNYVNVPPNAAVASNTVKPEHLKESLLSAIEHQISRRLKERFMMHRAETESLSENLNDLKRGNAQIRSVIERLEAERRLMNTNMLIYKERKIELEKELLRTSDKRESIDTVIEAATTVHKQIVDAYSADCAIDEAIYALGQAVKDKTIAVQTYLRHVRQLSRKQFVHRALIRKCRMIARLPPC